MKKLLIILTIVLLPSLAFASFSIKFENTFNKKMIYLLYWIDHPYKWPRPFNMAGGELQAFESRDLTFNYKAGKYYVIWRDESKWRHKMLIDIEEDVNLITITPKKSSVLKREEKR
jgi:hypothetical protein